MFGGLMLQLVCGIFGLFEEQVVWSVCRDGHNKSRNVGEMIPDEKSVDVSECEKIFNLLLQL